MRHPNPRTVEHVMMSAFVALEAAHAYSAVLPSIFTIRTFGHNPGTEQAIRDGEAFGTLFALGIGSVVSVLIRDPLPVVFSVATSAIMISVYEQALHSRLGIEVPQEVAYAA